jgi:carboxyl-terminal processing protease
MSTPEKEDITTQATDSTEEQKTAPRSRLRVILGWIFSLLIWGTIGITGGTAIGTVVGWLLHDTSRAIFNPGIFNAWWRVGEAMRLAYTRYYEPDAVTPERLAEGALEGLTHPVDRYSRYLSPKQYEEFNQRTSQIYTGIGATLRMFDGRVTILRVVPGGGAAECGLDAGDVILEADGKPLRSLERHVIEERISGREGTKARLRVWRKGADAPTDFLVPRRSVDINSVSGVRILDDGSTGFLRIENFEGRTAAEVARAVRELIAAGAKGLIIDLRGNPGGLVSTAVATVGIFCPTGTLIVSSHGRGPKAERKYITQGEPLAPKLPLAILVDRYTASASEIVAGAFQDLNRAIIIGDRTFGKGVVQTVFPLDGNDALQLTTSRYVLPSGRSIQGKGVRPDIHQPAAETRSSLLEFSESMRLAGRAPELSERFALPPASLADPQIETARETLLLLRSR